MSEEVLPAWAEVQKRTFTKWCNVHLKNRNMKIEDLSSDLHDGLLLVNLLEEISDKKIKGWSKTTKMRVQEVENVGAALNFMKSEGLKLTNIGPEDIVDRKTKLILGVIWTIILRYQIQKVSHEGEDKGKSVNAELLEWVNKAIPQYNIKNFKGDWKDGKAIVALANYLKPGLVTPTDDPLTNATNAIQSAETDLTIPAILEPADMVSDDADDLSIMTYISYYRDHDLRSKNPDAEHCYAYGPGLEEGVIEEENVFTVVTRNSFDEPINRGGASFNVAVKKPDGTNLDVQVNVADNNDGTYTVTYTPPAGTGEGPYNVEVNLNNAPISGSPFSVNIINVDPAVRAAAKDTVVDFSGLSGDPTPDGDRTFAIIPKNGIPAGSHFEAKIVAPDGSIVPSKVVPLDNGQFKVLFYPTQDGDYTIGVKLLGSDGKGMHVKGSPWKVNVKAPIYQYPRIIFPTYPTLAAGVHAKIEPSKTQPKVKHVLNNLPAGWQFLVDIKMVSPDGKIVEIEGSPFKLDPHH